jgi:hypothetical protein
MSSQPPSLPKGGRFGPMARLAVFAILPLLVLAGLLSVLIATGVLSLAPSSNDFGDTITALLIGPSGVLITGKDMVDVVSADGRGKVTVPAGSFNEPIILEFQELGKIGSPGLPEGYVSAGRMFDLSARTVDAENSSITFRPMLTISIDIGPAELGVAEDDFSRFFIQHQHRQTQAWDVSTSTADPVASTVTAKTGSLSRFALTVGPILVMRPRLILKMVCRRELLGFRLHL